MRTNLPNRLELLFRWVWAFPKASNIGFAWRIWRSRRPRRPFALRCDPLPDIDGEKVWLRGLEMLLENPAVDIDREWDGVGGGWTSVAMDARYWITFLVLSVFPAPDSPLRWSIIIAMELAKSKIDVRNENALIFTFFAHVNPSAFGNCKNVRWIIISSLTAILLDYCIGVKW